MGIFQPAFRSETSRKKQKTCQKDCEEPFKILKTPKKHQNCKKMKMTTDLEQWLIKPNTTSKQMVSDPLAAFRKMSLSIPEPKFCLPSILTSGNNSTWLATRKNDNEMAKSANFSAKSANVQIACDIIQKDNSNWLLKPQNKTETDLVTLTDLEGWLFVPTTDPGSDAKSGIDGRRRDSNPGLLDEWEKQSMTCNWIVENDNKSKSSHIEVEEWLKKALEDDEVDEITDDFDDCSIEVISQE